MEHVNHVVSTGIGALTLLFFRLDKRFVKPMDITRWVVVIFESKNRMTPGRVRGMIKDYIEACRTVG